MFVLPDQFPAKTEDKIAFFAVYDGHGTDLVSDHASRNLHIVIANRPEFAAGDYEGAIKGALGDEDAVLLDSLKESVEATEAGSTVAICLLNLTKGDLVVANLGDSHIILAERHPESGQPYRTQRLSKSHKPDVPDEKSRIESAGGLVNKSTGSARVGGLNMSRALGDLQYKNPVNKLDNDEALPKTRRASAVAPNARGNFLSNEPHLVRMKLQTDRRYLLVLVSDGISDISNDTALIQLVMRLSMRGTRAGDIAQEITNSAAAHPHSDNSSCIVVLLDGQNS